MPNWKKVIISGSDAELKSLNVSNAVTASDVSISEWGSVSASLSTLSEPNVKLFANETNIHFINPYDWYNGTNGATLALITGSVGNGLSHIADANAVYDYVNPISASIASELNSIVAGAYDLNIAGDTGTGIITNAETLTLIGGTNLTSVASGNGVTVNLNNSISLSSAVTASHFKGDGGALTGIDTDQVSEAGSLYYTDTRVKSKLNTEGVISGSSQVTIGSTSGYTTFSSSIASDIASIDVDVSSKPSKTSASGSRIGVWSNADTIRGYNSLHYFDNGGADIGIRLNPSVSTGRTIRMANFGGTTGGTGLITRTPGTTLGATINYVVYNSTTNRTAGRIGQEISTWDQSGGNITGTGFTSFQYGSLPADLEVSVTLSSGEMYLTMTWTGGGTYYCSANIDTFGPGI
mgnify:CR=1 FL=1